MRKVIRRQIAHRREGLDLAADVNAVIAINHGADANDDEGREDAPDTVRRTTVASSRVESDDRDQSPKEDR